jgi:hypothetical protein
MSDLCYLELGEKWPVNMARDSDFHVLLHAATWDRRLYFLSEGRHAGIFSPEKSDGFGRDRTRDLGYQRPAC